MNKLGGEKRKKIEFTEKLLLCQSSPSQDKLLAFLPWALTSMGASCALMSPVR